MTQQEALALLRLIAQLASVLQGQEDVAPVPEPDVASNGHVSTEAVRTAQP